MEAETSLVSSILTLSQEKQSQRLVFLFCNKILDVFIEQCEVLIDKGINLRSISEKYKLKYDLLDEYHSMRRVLDMTNTFIAIANAPDQGWKAIEIDERCTLSIKTNHTILELKSKGTVQTNMKHFLYLAYLIKLYSHCLPFCKEAHDLMQPTPLEKIGFIRLSIPIPFIKDRCTYLRGVGIDRLQKNGTVCIFAEGINASSDYLGKHKVNIQERMKGKQLLDIKNFVVQLKYINANQATYNGYAIVDHHIPLLPERFIGFMAKEIAKYLFNHLISQLKKFDTSIWAKQKKDNYQENKDFYEWIDSKQADIIKYSAQKHQ